MTRYLCALMLLTCFAFVGCSKGSPQEPAVGSPPANTAPASEPEAM